MSEGKRGWARWRYGVLGVFVCAVLAGAAAWLPRPDEVDPHDYLRERDDVVYGDGSLATVLAHYDVVLPDEATNVRFHDEESLVGSGGTLLLHFKVSDAGLTSFLQTLEVGPLAPGLPAGWDGTEGRRFGWSFQDGSWRGAQGPAERTVAASVAVGRTGGDNFVYAIATHA
jgi:hypothetical protein